MEITKHGRQSSSIHSPDEAGKSHGRWSSRQRLGGRYGTLDTETGGIEP